MNFYEMVCITVILIVPLAQLCSDCFHGLCAFWPPHTRALVVECALDKFQVFVSCIVQSEMSDKFHSKLQ